MNNKWIKYLVDPTVNHPFHVEAEKTIGNNLMKGRLVSHDGQIKYPIIDGIPRFVPENEYSSSQQNMSDASQTCKSFGRKWKESEHFNFTGNHVQRQSLEEQFLALLGVNTKNDLNSIFKEGMNCLDAGCGIGWSEYLFNDNKTVNRFAVDFSESVEVAYDKTKVIDNVFVAQADITNLPFKDNFFDIIYSNGVLHHTNNTENSFTSLCKKLKPGGLIGIYIYNKKPFLRELADKEIRSVTTKLSYEECHEFSRQITELGNAFDKISEPLHINKDIPILGIEKGKYNLQRFIYDHFLKCFFNQDLGYEHSVTVNIDWYHPKFACHHTAEEISQWFINNDIKDTNFIQPEGWEKSGFFVSGRKVSN